MSNYVRTTYSQPLSGSCCSACAHGGTCGGLGDALMGAPLGGLLGLVLVLYAVSQFSRR